jgi:hypothetical protein
MEGRVISVMRIMHFIQFLDDETVLWLSFALAWFL